MVVRHFSLVCTFTYPFPQALACIFGFLLVTLSKAMIMINPYVFDRLHQDQISKWSWGTLCFMEIYLILLGTFSCPTWYLQKVLVLNNIHIPDIEELQTNYLAKSNAVILFAVFFILVVCEIIYIVIKYRRTIRNIPNVRTNFVSQSQSVLSDLTPLNVLTSPSNVDALPANATASLSTAATASFSTAATTSPNAAARPSNVDASSSNVDATPSNVDASPSNVDVTPTNAAPTPRNVAASARNAAATTINEATVTIAAEPALSAATATNATAAPTNAAATSTTSAATPTNATATPTHAAASPTNAIATLINATDTHSHTATTPSNATATPSNAASTPSNDAFTLSNTAATPTISSTTTFTTPNITFVTPPDDAATPTNVVTEAAHPSTSDSITATPLSKLNTVTSTRCSEVDTPTPVQLQANVNAQLLATNPIRIEEEAPNQPGSSKFISIGLFTIGMYMLLNLVLRFSLNFLNKESPYYFLITVPERLMKQSMMWLILMCSPDVLQFISKAGFP